MAPDEKVVVTLDNFEQRLMQYKENIQRCSEEQEKAYESIVRAAEQRAKEISVLRKAKDAKRWKKRTLTASN